MEHESSIIAARLHDVDQEIARLNEMIGLLKKERAELEMAANVIARLTGVSAATGTAAGTSTATAQGSVAISGEATATVTNPTNARSVPEMIEAALLLGGEILGAKGMKPREITTIIRDNWKPDVKPTYVSTICWRMWKEQGKLAKDEHTGRYMLPETKGPSDKMPGEASEGSLFSTPAEGREAVPGGGT